MADNTIKLSAFTGMSNVEDAEELFVKQGVARPRIILNADVTNSGKIVKRDGQTKIINLTDGHSQWAGATCHLVMDGTTLKRITGKTATAIGSIGGMKAKTYYAEVGNLVYISNQYTNMVFDSSDNSLSAWGLAVPNGPVLTAGSGGLEAGSYHVCTTKYSGSDLSGSSPISNIVLSATGGIAITNRQSDEIVWCTDVNGDLFYRVGAVDNIVAIPSVEPLPTLFVTQPPFMENICHAFGRIWGSRGNIVYYSDAFHLDWFRPSFNMMEFATTVTMIARMKTGLFVGCEDRTYCMLGTEPSQMQQLDVGSGAVPGTLAYCSNIIELGDTISPPEKKHVSVPVWVSQEGIVIGNAVGRIFSLTQGKVKFAPGNEGASLYRQRNGEFQFLTSFFKGSSASSMGASDEATCEVIRNGKVI
jgi:hypothetical protein